MDYAEFLYKIGRYGEFENSTNIKLNDEHLLESAKENKLIFQVLNFLKNKQSLKKKYEDEIKKERIKNDEFINVIGLFELNRIEYLSIKGIAIKKHYPLTIKRHSRDFDLVVKDIRSFYNCAKILFKQGYEYEYNPMLTFSNNKILGIAGFTKTINGVKVSFEINIGGFLTTPFTWLLFEDISINFKKYHFLNQSINIPCDEINILILCAEIISNKMIRIRDIIDFEFISINSSINYLFLFSLLEKYNLMFIFNFLNQEVKNLKKGSYKNQPMRPFFNHIYPQIRNYGIKHIAFKAFLEFVRETFLKQNNIISKKLLSVIEKKISPKKSFILGSMIYLIPSTSKVKGNNDWITYKKLHIIQNELGSFIASNFGMIDEDLIKESKRYLENKQ